MNDSFLYLFLPFFGKTVNVYMSLPDGCLGVCRVVRDRDEARKARFDFPGNSWRQELQQFSLE